MKAPLIDEVLDDTLPIAKRIEKLAIDKATAIYQEYPQDVIIAGDTVVCLGDNIIGKPRDEQHAREILSQLSGTKHSVYTGVAIYIQGECISFVDKTDVYFYKLTLDMIDNYIDSKEWMGKAGAYAIQGEARCFVEKIDGSIDTVIGLPVDKVIDCLKEKGVI